jgi:bifunctional aspartokinase / homoserine dehydrogenase 1
MHVMVKVLKFGGSSVANAKNIQRVLRIISGVSRKNGTVIVVVSALGGVTDALTHIAGLAARQDDTYKKKLRSVVRQHNAVIDALISPRFRKSVTITATEKYAELQKELQGVFLIGDLSLRSLDSIMSVGEQLSALIICDAMKSRRIGCRFVDARGLIETDSNFGSANVNIQQTNKHLLNYFKGKQGRFIMGGFIASTEDGITTTLGRGGSDYTASLVGAALSASVVEIWTDVDGVLTADPRSVADAFPLPEISYEEASELAHFGAKVIHPKTMKPVRLKNIPIDIKNTFRPELEGTTISNHRFKRRFPITAISSLGNVCLLRMQFSNDKSIGELASRIFDTLSRSDIDVFLITQASHEQSLSVALDKKQAKRAKNAIEKSFALEIKVKQMPLVSVDENLSIVAIVGRQMKGVPGISGRLLSTLGDSGINVVAIAQGSSELNVSVVIESQNERRALQLVHETFFGEHAPVLHLFLMGTGLIGSTLLRQMEESNSPVRLCGLANSRHAIFSVPGVPLGQWKKKLTQGHAANTGDFISKMIDMHLPHRIFVDCTASEEVASTYAQILGAGIAVVTPNKKANSGPFSQFQALRTLARKRRVPFLYETNVGAGLPIIHTIQQLIASGDEVIKIEAVLSGTLSYIFNVFSDGSSSFSSIVRAAKAKGYTEPDPRDDMNGMDVARKLLILAREVGFAMEMKHVLIDELLPKRCFQVRAIDDFFTELETLDSVFEQRRSQARDAQKVLRFIARLDQKKARIGLEEIGQDHPFYQLTECDNTVSITTKRYRTTPLVIRGPGAGAAVTAGGVLADIMRIAELQLPPP